MNCPSRTDEPPIDAGWNQNPPSLAADLTTREDLNGTVNSRSRRSLKSIRLEEHGQVPILLERLEDVEQNTQKSRPPSLQSNLPRSGTSTSNTSHHVDARGTFISRVQNHISDNVQRVCQMIFKFGKFVGPGFMVAVAYIDPGNYSTDVAAGASKRFDLLFVVLMSNVFAIVLQSLAIRLGTVTGLNLAEHCRAHLPKWLNIVLYILGECAIIATDIAEVRIVLPCPIVVRY